MIRAVLFDWGNTLMRDLPGMHGPMAYWPRVEVLPGAAAMLAALRERGLGTALATNAADSDAALIRVALARGGLADFLDHIVCAGELGITKPDPAFFHAALTRLGVVPVEAVMVGDSWTADVQGARAAGLRAVWLAPPGTPRRSGAGVHTIHGLAELPVWLHGLG